MGPDGASVYWTEPKACIVRKLDLTTSFVSTVVGVPNSCGQAYGDFPALQASMSSPSGLAFWGTVMFISDSPNQVIRKLDPATNLRVT